MGVADRPDLVAAGVMEPSESKPGARRMTGVRLSVPALRSHHLSPATSPPSLGPHRRPRLTRARRGGGAELVRSLEERDGQRVALDKARRAVGRAAQTARAATDFALDDLAETLGRSPGNLAAFEAGELSDGAMADAIERTLAAEAFDAEHHNESGDAATAAMVKAIKEALDAFIGLRGKLRNQASMLRDAESRLKARLHDVMELPPRSRQRELEQARRRVEDRRMLALKAARNEAGLTAKEFTVALAKAGFTQPDGSPYAESKVREAESPDRKDRRAPTQEYVDAAINVLADRPSAERAAFDALRAVDESFQKLTKLLGPGADAPERHPLPRRRRPPLWVIAIAGALLAVVGVIALAVILRPTSSRRAAITSPRPNAIVSPGEFATGTAPASGGRSLWLVVEPQVHHAYHPQEGIQATAGGGWSGWANYGDQQTPAGVRFALDLVVVDAAANRVLADYVGSLPRPGRLPYPGLKSLPAGATILARVVVTRG